MLDPETVADVLSSLGVSLLHDCNGTWPVLAGADAHKSCEKGEGDDQPTVEDVAAPGGRQVGRGQERTHREMKEGRRCFGS